jgi:nicotinate-nucleotide pyrophosphorylase (carboxylating)
MQISHLIELALQEDLGSGDLTTDAIFGSSDKLITAKVIAKQEGIVCGIDFFVDTFKYLDDSIEISVLKSNGYDVAVGDTVLTLEGKASSILKGERTALNFLGRLSGVATLTNLFVKKVAHTSVEILDTRKTLPAYRLIDKFAVRIGGGKNHRIGLYDMVMIKDNHIDAAGSITAAVERVRAYLAEEKKQQIKIEVEVKNETELREALVLKVDRIMLDNMSPEQIRACVTIAKGQAELEVSGNVNLENVVAYAETGVDFISIGALTHSAKNFDFSMRF